MPSPLGCRLIFSGVEADKTTTMRTCLPDQSYIIQPLDICQGLHVRDMNSYQYVRSQITLSRRSRNKECDTSYLFSLQTSPGSSESVWGSGGQSSQATGYDSVTSFIPRNHDHSHLARISVYIHVSETKICSQFGAVDGLTTCNSG